MNVRYAAIAALACLAVGGCADKSPTSRPSMTQRQDAALRDPFGYGPTLDSEAAAARDRSTGGKNPSITGGGMTHYDPDAMKHDMDSVLNP